MKNVTTLTRIMSLQNRMVLRVILKNQFRNIRKSDETELFHTDFKKLVRRFVSRWRIRQNGQRQSEINKPLHLIIVT